MIGAGFPNNGLGLESPATLKYARTFGKQSNKSKIVNHQSEINS